MAPGHEVHVQVDLIIDCEALEDLEDVVDDLVDDEVLVGGGGMVSKTLRDRLPHGAQADHSSQDWSYGDGASEGHSILPRLFPKPLPLPGLHCPPPQPFPLPLYGAWVPLPLWFQ